MQLSATGLACFKACPYRFYLKYIKRILPAEEKTSLRWGTNWHTVLEILSLKPNMVYDGHVIGDDPMETAVEVMNYVYADKAGTKTPEDLQVEKIQILYLASAYRWYYANEPLHILTREQEFDIPIINPETGHKMRGVKLTGKIDKTGSYINKLVIVEHKSTTKSIDSDSTYWSRLNLDTQTTLYPLATRYIKDHEVINSVLYDVVHKPSISPKLLTQADSKKFVETGEYCGQQFSVEWGEDTLTGYANDVELNVEPGKKDGTFSIRETPEMYGARLLQDVSERPEFYFARREIARTEGDIERFHNELVCMVGTIRHMTSNESWFHNEFSCEATFRCDYIDMCYNNVNPDGDLPKTLVRKDKAHE